MNRSGIVGAAVVALTFAPSALAQPATTPASAPALAPLVVAEPHYVTFSVQIEVDRSAAETWQRVGKFCDIREWLGVSCKLLAGDDWALGSVRLVRGVVTEMLAGKTALSYTYTQPARVGVPFNAYHGTVEARPLSATRSQLIYSTFYDDSMLDAQGRAAERARRQSRFTEALAAMKALAEGHGLPTRP